MNSKISCLLLSLFICFSTKAQISIEDCYEKTRLNYPLIKQYDLIEKSKKFNLSNAAKGYLPQLNVSAKASYQSEVTEIPIDIPGINGLNKDQYGVSIDLSQTIWDGGSIRSKQKIIESNAELEQKNLEANLYLLNERINQLYFGILLLDANLEQNRLLQENLQKNLEQIKAYVDNGVANESDLNVIKVEQLKANQNQVQLKHSRKTYLEMLSALIGEELSENIQLEKPAASEVNSFNIQRPELFYYDAQLSNIDAMDKDISAGNRPKLSLFLTGGYGNPGLNMLRNEFSSYYIAGIRLVWNIGNLYTTKNNHQIIENKRFSVLNQKETFLFNTNQEIIRKKNDIRKYRDLLEYDDEIISLRNSVRIAAEKKVANGMLTTTDLVQELNAENLAVLDKILHETELLLAIYELKYVVNDKK